MTNAPIARRCVAAPTPSPPTRSRPATARRRASMAPRSGARCASRRSVPAVPDEAQDGRQVVSTRVRSRGRGGAISDGGAGGARTTVVPDGSARADIHDGRRRPAATPQDRRGQRQRQHQPGDHASPARTPAPGPAQPAATLSPERGRRARRGHRACEPACISARLRGRAAAHAACATR